MLIYNSGYVIRFSDYGIEIPSLYSRKSKTVSYLKECGNLKNTQKKWLLEEIPINLKNEDYSIAHSKEYVKKLFSEDNKELLYKAYELISSDGTYNRYKPDSAQKDLSSIINDIKLIINGTFFTIETALENDFAYFLGGGMHHAHQDYGHGFCALNDIAVSITAAQKRGLINTAWVIDVDAHRGDGTADIFSENESVKTLSIHMADGWPLDEPEYYEDGTYNRAFTPGDIDVTVNSFQNRFYNILLSESLEKLSQYPKPDIAIVVGGVDPYELDELPSTETLKLSKEELFTRDMNIYNFLVDQNIPQAWLAAGGYGQYSWEIHAQFLETILALRYI